MGNLFKARPLVRVGTGIFNLVSDSQSPFVIPKVTGQRDPEVMGCHSLPRSCMYCSTCPDAGGRERIQGGVYGTRSSLLRTSTHFTDA